MSGHLNFPTLEVDLGAIVRNYRLLAGHLVKGSCAAVVKANAYGLGAIEVSRALYGAGCREFFVATLDEGVALRTALEEKTALHIYEQEALIYVFHGSRKGQAKDFLHHRLIPVLNDLVQIKNWAQAGPAALHIDTGMCRLGIAPEEVAGVASDKWKVILSHLACANDKAHPKNAEQLGLFKTALAHFPGVRASLCNSSGIFLGADYHFDLARPGCSLYGISPDTTLPNPMENVVRLSAPVLQYRAVTHDQTVGYGALAIAKKGVTLATIELGYADGFPRILTGHAYGYAHGIRLPVLGRISMDMVSVDVSALSEAQRTADLRITLIGPEQPVDVLAEAAQTIGYEIFTGLGSRVKRIYHS